MKKSVVYFVFAAVFAALAPLFAFVIALPVGNGLSVSKPFAAEYGKLSKGVDVMTLASVAAEMKTMSMVLTVATIVSVIAAALFLVLGLARRSHEREQESTQICPSCAERVKAEATICRYCSTELTRIVEAEQPKLSPSDNS